MDFGLGLILSFTDNATAGINNAANQLMRLTQMAEQSTDSINRMADLTALSSLSTMTGQLGDTFLSMGTTITGMFQKLLQGTVDTGSQFESLRITVNALTGDAQKGQEAISKLMSFAAKTPFEINDLSGMFTTITANGLDAFKTMTSAKNGFQQEMMAFIGDLMAFRPDVPAMQWGTAIRNAFSGEVRSLKNALDVDVEGILGRSWGDTPEQIAQDFADLADNLGVAGLMMSNMDTWSQTLSNVSDQFTRLFLAVADAGVFNDLKEALQGVTSAIFEISDADMASIAKVIAESLSFIIKPLVSAGKAIGNFIRWVTKLTTTQPKLAKFVIQMTAFAGVLLTLTGLALKVVSSLSGLATVFMAMGGSFSSMKSILVGGLKAITARLLPLGLAIGGMYLAWKTDFAGIRTLITGFVQNLMNSFSTARGAINMSVGGMMNVVTDLQSKGGFWNNLTVGLMKLMIVCRALSELWNSEDGFTLSEDTFLKAKELGVLPLIEAILDLKYRFGLFKEGFIAGFKEVSDSIKNFIQGLHTNLKGTFIDTALEKLTSFFHLLASGDADAWYKFGESFGKFTAKAIVFFAVFKVLDSIFGKVTKVVTAITGIGKAFGTVGKIVGGVGKAVGKLFPTFSKLGGFLKAAVEVMMLPGSFADKMGAIFPKLTGAVMKFIGFFSKIGEVISLTAGGAGTLGESITAVFGPVATVLSGVISVIAGIGLAVVNFVDMFKNGFNVIKEILMVVGIALAAVGAIILGAPALVAGVVAGIVALVATLVVVVKEHWNEIKAFLGTIGSWIMSNVITPIANAFKTLWNGIVEFLQPVIDVLLTMWESFKTMVSTVWSSTVDFFKNIWEGVVETFNHVKDRIVGFFGEIVDGVKSIWENVMSYITPAIETFNEIKDTFAEFVGFIASKATALWTGTIQPVFQKIGSFVSGIFQAIWDKVQTVWNAIWGFIGPIVTSIYNTITTTFTSIWQSILNILTAVWETVRSIFTGIFDTIMNVLSSIWNGIVGVFNGIVSFIGSILGGIWSTISNVLMGIMNFIMGKNEEAKANFLAAWEAIKGIFSGALSAIWSIVTSIFNAIKGVITSILDGIKSVVTSAWNGIKSVISSVLSGISSIVNTIWNGIKSTISNVISGIRSVVSTGFNAVRSTVSSIGASIKSTVSSVFNAVKNTISNVMNGAKSIVSGALSRISGFFSSCRLQLPHIALPHFSISGSLSINPPSVPHLSVSWYEKGGVFDKPSVIGVGENGQEAVMPLEKNTGWISVLASKVGNLINSNSSSNNTLISSVTGAFTSALSGISSAVSSLTPFLPEVSVDSPEPFKPTPTPTDSGSPVIPGNYYTNNNTQQTTTQGGDTDNSVTFNSGAIVIQANGASEAEAERLADLIMDKIARKQQIKKMAHYKNINAPDPELAY